MSAAIVSKFNPREYATVSAGLEGKRFGRLTCVKILGWRLWRGEPRILMAKWLCDCGRSYRANAYAPTYENGPKQCVACGRDYISKNLREKHAVRVGEKTLYDIAAESGVPFDTVYQRWRRGWPGDALGAPVGTKHGVAGAKPVRRFRP